MDYSLASRRRIFGIFFELNEMIFEHFWVTLRDFWDLLDKYDINNSIEDIFEMQWEMKVGRLKRKINFIHEWF